MYHQSDIHAIVQRRSATWFGRVVPSVLICLLVDAAFVIHSPSDWYVASLNLLASCPACSIAMVILADDDYIDHPYPFCSRLCPIAHRFVFLRSGTAQNSPQTFTLSRDRNFTQGRIVRAGFANSDLFALALTLYFPTLIVLAVDFNHFLRFDSQWIDGAVAHLFASNAAAVAARVTDGVASHAILTRSSLMRRFLVYTDVRYSDTPAMAVFSRWAGGVAEIAGDNELVPTVLRPFNLMVNALGCPSDTHSNRSDVALIIPTFKRAITPAHILPLTSHGHRPTRIFILQNYMHVLLDFRVILEAARQCPVVHVWCTNWNSFFFLTYVLMMFVPERFVMKMDDDILPLDGSSFTDYVRTATADDVIVGLGGPNKRLATPICGIEAKIAELGNRTDHVALVVLFNTQACKIMNRFQWYTILHAEDVAICYANAMECGTRSVAIPFPHRANHRDPMRHDLDPDFIKTAAGQNPSSLYLASVCHNIRGGYRPVLWTNFTITNPIDIRLPY
jgi:hypothetical protein